MPKKVWVNLPKISIIGAFLVVLSASFSSGNAFAAISNEPVLSVVVINSSLPNYQTAVPGPLNGQINGSNLFPLNIGIDLPSSLTWVAPNVSAYLRTWTNPSEPNATVGLESVAFSDSSSAAYLLSSWEQYMGGSLNGVISSGAFPTPNLRSGAGYEITLPNNNSYSNLEVVMFQENTLDFFVFLKGPGALFSPNQALQLALSQQQSAEAQGVQSVTVTTSSTSNSSKTYEEIAIGILVALALVAVYAWINGVEKKWAKGEGIGSKSQ
ncbi:MAG: hypothetical protein HKL80_01255 [Acidimicrobiales bacterium]|nr:hypothetical protein [Acidimicrobiales bacterium]